MREYRKIIGTQGNLKKEACWNYEVTKALNEKNAYIEGDTDRNKLQETER